MAFGPIVRRELLTASRRGSTYGNRASAALTVLVVNLLHAAVCDYTGRDRTSLDGVRRFAIVTFGLIVCAMTVLTAAVAVAEVAVTIAREREKKGIDALLLATRLGSAEIVLGALGAGLIRHLSNLAAVFPVLALMVPLWGVDPWLKNIPRSGPSASGHSPLRVGSWGPSSQEWPGKRSGPSFRPVPPTGFSTPPWAGRSVTRTSSPGFGPS